MFHLIEILRLDAAAEKLLILLFSGFHKIMQPDRQLFGESDVFIKVDKILTIIACHSHLCELKYKRMGE